MKCRRQVDPQLYKGNIEGFSKIYRAEGLRGNFTGWGPTLVGYSFQGTPSPPQPSLSRAHPLELSILWIEINAIQVPESTVSTKFSRKSTPTLWAKKPPINTVQHSILAPLPLPNSSPTSSSVHGKQSKSACKLLSPPLRVEPLKVGIKSLQPKEWLDCIKDYNLFGVDRSRTP